MLSGTSHKLLRLFMYLVRSNHYKLINIKKTFQKHYNYGCIKGHERHLESAACYPLYVIKKGVSL